MVDTRLLAPQTTRKLKRVEYDQLVATGAFEEERVELLEGEIVTMSPNYPEHASPVQLLTEMLLPPLVGRAVVRIQLPMRCGSRSPSRTWRSCRSGTTGARTRTKRTV